jgi:eukaryotic-like serine/threonine-protein kinase
VRVAWCACAVVLFTGCRDKSLPVVNSSPLVTVAWRAQISSVASSLSLTRGAITSGSWFLQHIAGSKTVGLDRTTGRELWASDSLGGTMRLLVSGGRLILASHAVHGIDTGSGRVVWSTALSTSGRNCAAAADLSVVYACTVDWHVTAIAAATGQVLWDRDLRDSLRGSVDLTSVEVSGDTVYATVIQRISMIDQRSVGRIFALDARSGAVLTVGQLGDYSDLMILSGAPRVAGRLLLYGDAYVNRVLVIDRFTMREAWRFVGERGFVGSNAPPAVEQGVVFFASGDQHAYALDLATGALRWKSSLLDGSQISAEPCGRVVAVWSGTNTRLVDKSTGRFLAIVGPTQFGPSHYSLGGRTLVDGNELFVHGDSAVRKLRCAA